MLSRIADSLFWLNRYMERADGLLRVTYTNYILSLDKGVNNNLTWKPLLEIFTYLTEEEIATIENDTDAVLKLLITDTSNPNSLKVILTRARENARGVQDHITKEVWEQVNHMYHLVNHDLHQKLLGYEAVETIENFSRNSLLFIGVTDTTMPRGLGWSFMNLGRLIERCTQTIEITDKQFASIDYELNKSSDIIFWRYLLLSLSGYELHLKTYHTSSTSKEVLHQVLINSDFTRSVLYTLNRIEKYLHDVMLENKLDGNDALSKFYGRLHSRVKYVDFDTLNGITLQHFLQDVRDDMLEFSSRLAQLYFSYT
ncbi:alpha-E domain-containing protein [Panacibacter sp. DH6]|uniref:Alpha-E domain-containing protein n=1 Tax=Panacibacter microcysteis TaxID=2793269 RepID=A0A931E166_9BACT|nr:alpha-E domain-containing protein [Panacibacter microcysteis]MBG9376732.1 alpha-E domain-containing protein [Panacibacter microcysteis]